MIALLSQMGYNGGMLLGYIYKITSPTHRIYVGRTRNIQTRAQRYRGGFCHKQRKLYASIQKYGWEAHQLEVIERTSFALLAEREKFWIQELKTFNTQRGLNLTRGGESNDGHKHTRKSKSKMSQAKRKRKTKFAVHQYTLDGVFVQSFLTITDAARSIGKQANTTNISGACDGKRTKAYGFQWSRRKVASLGIAPTDYELRQNCRAKKCGQYLDGNLVAVFNSQAEAERQTGILSRNINKVLQGQRNSAGGYQWRNM